MKSTATREELIEYGFVVVEGEHKSELENEFDNRAYCDYYFSMGHARRGQFYYLLIGSDGTVSVFASKPDGSGCSINMHDILLQMINDGKIV